MPNKKEKFRNDIISALSEDMPKMNAFYSKNNEYRKQPNHFEKELYFRNFDTQEFLNMIESLSDEQKLQYQDIVSALNNGNHHLEYSVRSFEKDDDTHSDFEIFLVDNENRTNSKQITLPDSLRLMTAYEYMKISDFAIEFLKNNPELREKREIKIEEIDDIIAKLPEDEQKNYETYKYLIKDAIESLVLQSEHYCVKVANRNNKFNLVGGCYYTGENYYPETYHKMEDVEPRDISLLALREQTLLDLEKEDKAILEELKDKQNQKEGQDIGE